MPIKFESIAVILACVLTLLGGCVTETVTQRGGLADFDGKPLAERVAPTQGVSYKTHIVPLGSVPYNRETLPLISPDGRFIATETGAAPTLPTSYAAPGASPPIATTIEIYSILPPPKPANESFIRHVATVDATAVLGRSCDDGGFLIEAPQSDGSRWIGRVEWATGRVTWLVQDGFVNAFAALGPDGKLAWSRRTIEGEDFELVVSTANDSWAIAEEGVDWLFPTWTASGDGLFAERLAGQRLEMAFLYGGSEASMRQSMQTIRLSNEAGMSVAYQVMVPQPARLGAPQPEGPHLIFLHPAYPGYGYRPAVAIWRPFRGGRQATKILEPNSLVAAIHPNGWMVYAVDDELIGRSLDGDEPSIRLTREFFVPRVTSSEHWPFILMAPYRQEPRIFLTGMPAAGMFGYSD